MSNNNVNLTQKDKFAPTPQFIAYLDILGYKQKIGKNGEHAAKLARTIDDHIKRIKRSTTELDLKEMKYVDGDIKMKAFSDNILLCSESNWYSLFSLVAILQGRMAEDGMFIRGSMCHGQLYFDNEFVCGQGIVLAHEIENDIAIYPRIIVHQTYIDAVNEKLSEKQLEPLSEYDYIGATSQVWCDFDGYRVLDYLLLSNKLAPYQDKPNEIVKKHKEHIVNELKTTPLERVRQKFLWSRNYHNCFIDRATAMGFPVGEYYISDMEVNKNGN